MASKYRKKCSLPVEFYPILESYSREVLRDQHLDIIEYSYLYFKAMEEVSAPSITTVNREHWTHLTTPRRGQTFLHPSMANPNPNLSRCNSKTKKRSMTRRDKFTVKNREKKKAKTRTKTPMVTPTTMRLISIWRASLAIMGRKKCPMKMMITEL